MGWLALAFGYSLRMDSANKTGKVSGIESLFDLLSIPLNSAEIGTRCLYMQISCIDYAHWGDASTGQESAVHERNWHASGALNKEPEGLKFRREKVVKPTALPLQPTNGLPGI